MSRVRVYVTKVQGYSALTYSYDVNQHIGFEFHLLCEVGEPWQEEAKALSDALAEERGCVIQPTMLLSHPWYIDALFKKATTPPQKDTP